MSDTCTGNCGGPGKAGAIHLHPIKVPQHEHRHLEITPSALIAAAAASGPKDWTLMKNLPMHSNTRLSLY